VKKNFKQIILFLLVCLISIPVLNAQTIDEAYKRSSIDKIVELVNEYYVFPEVAEKTGKHIEEQLKAGTFKNDSTFTLFAYSLTRELQSINHDKHMRVRTGTPQSPLRPPAGNDDAGFKEVKMLEGNIGYIDLRLFFPPTIASSKADEAMKKLEGAKAIIIDLRSNGGGSPDMVQYLCSYFFDKRIHLNSLYSRLSNSTNEFWTKDVKGKKLPDIPLYVLTSKKTFSGAEEFSYNMQTQKRATLIGETTGGGANPGGIFPVNDQLNIFIPTGTAINPITKTNWEGTGVKPDIAVAADKALEEALLLATTRAQQNTEKKKGF
jgi:C-terminal processing protease CtpA/Prc